MSKHRVLQRPIHGLVVSNIDLLARTVGGAFDHYSVASKRNDPPKEDLRKVQVVVVVTKAVTEPLKEMWIEWAKKHEIPVLFHERKAAVLQALQDNFEIVEPEPEPEPEPEKKSYGGERETEHVPAPSDDPIQAALAGMREAYEARLEKEKALREESDEEALRQAEKAENLRQQTDELEAELRKLRADSKNTEERARARAETVLEDEVEKATKKLRDKNRRLNKTINEQQKELKNLKEKTKDLRDDVKKRAKQIEDLQERMKGTVFDHHDLDRVLSAAIVGHAICFTEDEDLRDRYDEMVSKVRADPNFSSALKKAHWLTRKKIQSKDVDPEAMRKALRREGPLPENDPEFVRISEQ